MKRRALMQWIVVATALPHWVGWNRAAQASMRTPIPTGKNNENCRICKLLGRLRKDDPELFRSLSEDQRTPQRSQPKAQWLQQPTADDLTPDAVVLMDGWVWTRNEVRSLIAAKANCGMGCS